jgi:hypothetical protein
MKRGGNRARTDATDGARSEAARERAFAEVEVLREWCAWVRGDPKLSAWEEAFATSIFHGLDAENRRFLSGKQKAIVWEIGAKVGFRGEPIPDSEDDDQDDDLSHPYNDAPDSA